MSEHGPAHAAIVPPDYWGAEDLPDIAEIPADTWETIDRWLAEHPGGRERLIPLLHRVQQRLGWLPFPVLEYVADRLGMSPVEVHGVVSFYHFFTTTPRGRFQLKVCMGTACFVRHADGLVDAIREELGIGVGEVTDDRLFSLEQVRCIGACSIAPAMMVGDEVHGNLDGRKVKRLVRRLRREAAGGGSEDDGEDRGEAGSR